MKVKDITKTLQQWAPLSFQEDYDNSGLLVGSPDQPVQSVLITLDVTEEIMHEAISSQTNLIIAHHPLIFKGVKKINNSHWVDRCIYLAIRHDIAIYAIHTNLDNVGSGVNHKIAQILGLIDLKILSPRQNTLSKLVTFVPKDHAKKVLDALYQAGAGTIGNYDHCSFTTDGTGTFRPNEKADPYLGQAHVDESVNENRIEILFPTHLQNTVISSLHQSHPYEEVAYYLTPLANAHQEVGSGMTGQLPTPVAASEFLLHLKKKMNVSVIRHTRLCRPTIQKVALCGGSGSFLLSKAIAAEADIFITGDFKYHDFFEADNQIIIADIGHYESEAFTKELLYDFLREKFANIAVRLSEVNTNPIIYL
ncbi:MAG: Nif3-like dinuclear metal center hexameric protein [Cyclobacteriaceae bacterium]|nr:Nif3-like dinuclear metal center hexameric protein [Cyclobacteriaceae bacterium]